MAKVTNVTSQTLENAIDIAEITDTRGRKIAIKKPPILRAINFKKILGEHADNQAYFKDIVFYNWVDSIDGEKVLINSELQLDALIQRLDYEGLDAIMEGVALLFPNAGESEPEAKEVIKK